MKLETACYGFAVIGLILTGIGRTLLVREADSVSTGWKWAVKLLPLADIMFLARFWDSAKLGAMLSMAGLVFLMPLGAKTLYEQDHPRIGDFKSTMERLSADDKNSLFHGIKMEHDVRMRAKQRKLTQLNEHMGAWYSSMQNRRENLSNASPAEITAFNEEAAAYAALLEVTKEEAAEFQKMIDHPMEGWSTITDEEYADYQRRMMRARNRVIVPLGSEN